MDETHESARIRGVTFDCVDPYPLVVFWSKVTGFKEDPENRNEPDDPLGLLLGPDGGLQLLFVRVADPPSVRKGRRLDLVLAGGDQDEAVDRLLRLGATLVADHRQSGEDGSVVLADPEGNEFSVTAADGDGDGAAAAAVVAAPAVAEAGYRVRSAPAAEGVANPEPRTGPPLGARLASLFSREVVARLRLLIRLALLVVEALIAVRILFKVLGANEHAGFSSFVFNVTSPFVSPFHPVFGDQLVNGHPFELGSLLAMAVYAALAYLAVRLMRLIFSPYR